MKKKFRNIGLALFLTLAVHASFAFVGGQMALHADTGSCDPDDNETGENQTGAESEY